jgi:hypothetical protein
MANAIVRGSAMMPTVRPAIASACKSCIEYFLNTSANLGRNEIETFIIRLRKISKTTEKMLSVWFDIVATVPKINSVRREPCYQSLVTNGFAASA